MKLAVMFNGQGAHFAKMGLDFKEKYEEAAAVFEEATRVTGYSLEEWLKVDITPLNKTANAQVAIAATSLAIFRSIETWLPEINCMGGLSLGEYSALIASGMLDQHDGWQLLKARGQLMSAHCETIADAQMGAVVGMPLNEIEVLVSQIASDYPLYIANYNSPNQIVIAGTSEAVKAFKLQAKSLGYKKVLPLKVEGPFHSPLMEAVQIPLAEVLNTISFKEGAVPVWSNVTVQPHNRETLKDNLIKHLVNPVYWYQTIDRWVEEGVTHVIQIGPGDTLAKLLANHHSTINCLVINQIEDVEQLKDFFKE